MKFFKPEDFDDWSIRESAVDLADHANSILKERGVRVYMDESQDLEMASKKREPGDTHQGLLVAIEELPKKECEHEPITRIEFINEDKTKVRLNAKCKCCGVKLKAKWEVAE